MKSVGPKKNVILPLLCGKNVFPGQILREIWGWAGKYQGNGKANRFVNRKSRSFPAGKDDAWKRRYRADVPVSVFGNEKAKWHDGRTGSKVFSRTGLSA